VDLLEAIRTNGTCRLFRSDPVPDEALRRAFDAARFAPQGGNRQPVRWIVVRDRARKKQLRDWYLEPWKVYVAGIREGAVRVGGGDGGARAQLVELADRFAENLHEVPVLVVVCAEEASLHATDRDLDRRSVVGGASIYPAVQNFLLGCRAEGLGTALTTLLCAFEPKVKKLLAIPDGFLTAAHVAVGYPERPFPKRLARRPLEDAVFGERFGERLFGPR
jgi:nitroreductase